MSKNYNSCFCDTNRDRGNSKDVTQAPPSDEIQDKIKSGIKRLENAVAFFLMPLPGGHYFKKRSSMLAGAISALRWVNNPEEDKPSSLIDTIYENSPFDELKQKIVEEKLAKQYELETQQAIVGMFSQMVQSNNLISYELRLLANKLDKIGEKLFK